MKKVYKDRLTKLANHLLKGKLGHKKFDFSVLNVDEKKDEKEIPYSCGTNGCALGECPIVFPRQWKFDGDIDNGFDPVLRRTDCLDSFDNAETFFGINTSESLHLFSPYSQDPGLYGGESLDRDATKEQVANNILAFIKMKEKESNE